MIAADPSKWFSMRPGLVGTPEDLQALQTSRTGMIATPAMQRYFGWKVGDKIPFKSSMLRHNGSADWTFDLVGTFDVARKPNEVFLAIINFAYLDAERVDARGTAERFLIKIADPNRSAQTAAAIDQMFANSPHETRTRSEKEMAQSRLKQIGDVKFITNAIIGAVLFTLLFVTGNTMRQAVHERTSGFGVLKAVGFSGATILLLVLMEALILCVLAAAIGLAAAAGVAPLLKESIGAVDFSWPALGKGMLIAIALAAISAMLPAWRIWRLTVVDALAGR